MLLLFDTLSLVVGFVVVVAVGHALRATGRLPASAAHTLNTVVTDVTMPALILATLGARAIPAGAPRAVVAATLGLGAALVLGTIAARALGAARPAQGAIALTAGFSNTGFLGIPLVLALYPAAGEAGATAVLVDAFVTTLWLYTAGVFWARRQGEGGESAPPILRLLATPATVAVVAGLAMSLLGLHLPAPVARLATLLGGATVPLVFLALGLRLDWKDVHGRLRPILAASVIRLGIVPAVVFGVAVALGLRGPVRDATVLEAAMPSSMMAAVLADRYGCDGPLGTAAVVFTTLLGVLSIPLWVGFLHAVGP
ncbi:MAG: AEC family transporter [Byssovorax sp.]